MLKRKKKKKEKKENKQKNPLSSSIFPSTAIYIKEKSPRLFAGRLLVGFGGAGTEPWLYLVSRGSEALLSLYFMYFPSSLLLLNLLPVLSCLFLFRDGERERERGSFEKSA